MSATECVTDMLDALATGHAQDEDGGYAYAFAIRDLYRSLEASQQTELLTALASSILKKELTWGVSTEAMIQIGVLPGSAELMVAVQSGLHDLEWRDDVTFMLLSLRYAAQPGFYEEYVDRALEGERPHAIPLAAMLARIDPERSTALLGKWLVNARARAMAVEGYAPTVVRNYLSADERLLADLVRKMRELNVDAARWFAGCLNNYLAKPWMLKELGEARSASIRAGIAAASSVSN